MTIEPEEILDGKDLRNDLWDVPRDAEDPARCVREVWERDGWHKYQCSRKRGHGPGNLYCKQHAKQVGKPA